MHILKENLQKSQADLEMALKDVFGPDNISSHFTNCMLISLSYKTMKKCIMYGAFSNKDTGYGVYQEQLLIALSCKHQSDRVNIINNMSANVLKLAIKDTAKYFIDPDNSSKENHNTKKGKTVYKNNGGVETKNNSRAEIFFTYLDQNTPIINKLQKYCNAVCDMDTQKKYKVGSNSSE